MLPEKPKKDKWINAKDYSWFFEYEPDSSLSEEEWFTRMKTSCGKIMQTLADEAEYNGIEITRCKDCVFCKKLMGRHYCGKLDLRVKPKKDFCSNAERRADE